MDLAMILPFWIYGAGSQEKQCDIIRNNGSLFHQLIFSLDGEGELQVDEETYTIEAGDVIFIESGQAHSYRSKGGRWSTGWIIFNGKNIEETLTALELQGISIIKLNNDQVIMNQFREILSVYESSSAIKEVMASSKLYELLVLLYQFNHLYKKGHKHTSVDVINHVQSYIQEFYYKDISLEYLAKLVGLTPQYLCKTFKDHCHIGIIEYMSKIRLQEAKKLLIETDLPIKEIVSRVGYNDCSYFGKIFKRYEKMTPTEFRGA